MQFNGMFPPRPMMEDHQSLPDPNRLSVLASTILLAYALAPFINLPERKWVIQIAAFIFSFNFNLGTTISFLAAGLAAVGMDWLIQDHPRLKRGDSFRHWILPALTSWAIGVPLNNLAMGLQWWAVFALGGALLILVFVAEYIVVDLSDARHPPATVGLTAVSFALYLILAIAVRAAGLRLYLLLLALGLPVVLVCMRTFYLRLDGNWHTVWALAIGMVTGQFAIGLQYLPVSPLEYGLLMLGMAYALTSLVGSIIEQRSWRTLWIEPALMLAILWGLAVFL